MFLDPTSSVLSQLPVPVTQLMSPFFTSRAGQFFWLFKGARVESTGEFVGAIIGSFVFAVMATIAVEAAKLVERRMIVKGSGVAVVPALIGGLAHGFRLALHYLAMLLIMTFNVWVFLAVVGGHAVGYTLHRLGSTMLGGKGDADEASGLGSAGRAKAVGSSSDSDPPVAHADCC